MIETYITIPIGDSELELPVELEYQIHGRYRPATQIDPEEYPELEIESMEIPKKIRKQLFKLAIGDIPDDCFEQVEIECWDDHANR